MAETTLELRIWREAEKRANPDRPPAHDIGLPGLNGRQIADAARVSRPKLPVLFMTGYTDTAVVNQGGLDEGMSIITKPFDFDDLGVRVREVLSHT